ncbi:hypothetical protein [Lysobacter enzymogenes]|uniref:hypothetical protein n=1 Tax=Lysobacter enzymogenes TaxID=69 RepID=UPI001AF7E822|nr:hypothetical protein [Lysobacter enzymogenes]QQQ02933.1 hypothetical protein JHW41_08215 [Lysobacter enzymogenes]
MSPAIGGGLHCPPGAAEPTVAASIGPSEPTPARQPMSAIHPFHHVLAAIARRARPEPPRRAAPALVRAARAAEHAPPHAPTAARAAAADARSLP